MTTATKTARPQRRRPKRDRWPRCPECNLPLGMILQDHVVYCVDCGAEVERNDPEPAVDPQANRAAAQPAQQHEFAFAQERGWHIG